MSDMCPRCKGRLHVRVRQGTWERCPDCARRVMSGAIKPGLRGKDTTLPPEIEGWPAIPLRDAAVFHADPNVFRRWAWRSLLDYEGLVYDWIEGFRLVDAYFQQDSEYPNVRAIQDLPLLILDFSTVRVSNSMLGGLFVQTLVGRQRRDMPTWCYVQDMDAVRKLFGQETVTLLQNMRFGVPGASASTLPAIPTSAPVAEVYPESKPRRYDPNAV